jgi:hypothetical protein
MSAILQCPNGRPIPSTTAVCPVCGTHPRPEPIPLPTEPALPAVPGYELLGVLGRGGMGWFTRPGRPASTGSSPSR